MAEKLEAFRIAMRTTDDGWWIALLCKIDEPEEQGIEISRIRRSAVKDPTVRQAFIEVQKLTIESLLKDRGIAIAEWQHQKPMSPSQGRA